MSVVAKFFCQKVTRTEGSSTADQVVLGAVCRGVENALWSQYTPAGTITLGILNESATAQFVEGEEYLVTFTRTDRPLPGDQHAPRPVRDKYGHWVCEVCGLNPSYDVATHGYGEVPLEVVDWTMHRRVYEAGAWDAPLPGE